MTDYLYQGHVTSLNFDKPMAIS